ncbi:MAG: ornithine cyclodeaminase family protein [Rhodobacteraceae bacterium]|nr:ornithine cyclodeaminase family protein [Paracoccaceae bacterium]
MLVVTEEACRRVIGRAEAFAAVEGVFAAMARGAARNFPVLREALGHADAIYGVKSGFDAQGLVLGLKSGGYWPGNAARGLTNHQSVVILFDPDSGRPTAMVGGNHLTAMRTAAAAAVSIARLARADARVLGILGAGFQSAFQIRAALAQRPFERILAWNYHPEMLPRLAAAVADTGVPFESVSLDALGAAADVIITVTSSFAPQLMKAHVRPGTHLACMGTDTRGKQEVEPALLAAASVFTDEVAQAVSIGECQHAVAAGLLAEDAIIPLGAVVLGAHPGRRSEDEITLYDGTGIGLQDLAVAAVAARLARAQGLATEVDW